MEQTMSTKFNPVQGFSIEFHYDRSQIASAISTQVSIWVHGIAGQFLGLCEDTVNAGRVQRQKANRYAAEKTAEVKLALMNVSRRVLKYLQHMLTDLIKATGRRIQTYLLNLVMPTVQAVIETCLNSFQRVDSVCEQYVAKSYDIALAETQSPVILPSVFAALSAVDEPEIVSETEPQSAPIAEPVADAPMVASIDSPVVVKSMAAQAPKVATTKVDGLLALRRKAKSFGIPNAGRMNTAQLLQVLGDRVVQE
jgi:hypothetical protein